MFERLRDDRSKLRAFTEEAMRMRSPTHGLSTRMTSRDEVFQGVDVPAGSLLHLRFGAANVDAEEFDCPFDLDLDREGVTRHVAFSAGPRVCPGANLSARRTADRLGRAARSAGVDRVRPRERLAAPARHHARHVEARPSVPASGHATVARHRADLDRVLTRIRSHARSCRVSRSGTTSRRTRCAIRAPPGARSCRWPPAGAAPPVTAITAT